MARLLPRWLALAAALGVLGLLLTPAAPASTRLVVGFADNVLLWEPAWTVSAASQLGTTGFRVSVNWAPGQTQLTQADTARLDGAVTAAGSGMRIVLVVVGGAATYAPLDDDARTTFCTYARNILARYPAIEDLVVWNEPNKTSFWRPQFNTDQTSAAPAAYQALLARCYDVLHAARPEVRVLGPALSPDGNDNPNATSNISHSPGNFIRKLGDAYRASARATPILDVVAHHVYGAFTAERPWRRHVPGVNPTRIAQGDWDKLMTNLHTAFDGTGQPVPGECVAYRCVSIAYMEGGFQTSIDAGKTSLYTSTENVSVIPDDAGGEPASPPPPAGSSAPDQSTQIVDAVRLAACQNYVGAFFNFTFRDDTDLRGWQSGPLWADGSHKDSYWAFDQVFAEAASGTIDCAALKGGLPPRPDTVPPAAPPAPTASTVSGRRFVTLDWPDGAEEDLAGYEISRSTSAGGPYTRLGTELVRASSYVDSDVEFGQTYYYVVAGVDSADNVGGRSPEASATPNGGPTAVSLTGFVALRQGHGVLLRWRLANAVGILGCRILREQDGTLVRLGRGLTAPASGRSELLDRFPPRQARYWLEVVRLDGSRVRYGPRRARS